MSSALKTLSLFNRLGLLGEGARVAGGRRDLAKKLEVRRRREAAAHFEASVRGRGLSRVGQIFVC